MNNFTKYLREDKISEFPISLIKEGLILSWEYDKLVNILKKNFNLEYKLTEFCLEITFYREYITKEVIDKFNQILNLSGYYVALYYINNNKYKGTPSLKDWFNNYDKIKLELNKKFDSDSNGVPLKMFHVTELKNIEKIKKIGLIPLSYSKIEDHPDRIYLFNNVDSAIYFKNDIVERYNLEDRNMIILEIDTRLINKIKLYIDPKFGDKEWGAYYTYSNISPFAIMNL